MYVSSIEGDSLNSLESNFICESVNISSLIWSIYDFEFSRDNWYVRTEYLTTIANERAVTKPAGMNFFDLRNLCPIITPSKPELANVNQ